ncbi:MAG: hypothetical protein M0P61_01420 [Ignavibacteriaceae bacterium]|jgi:hypothetical protein|nr:hypothetical protein [Ignavibacteriaceae bacterium]
MKKHFFILFLLISFGLHAQDLGFGCLGLVGGFAGYGIQTYQTKGINERVDFFNALHKDSLNSPLKNFGQAAGYRFGINFFNQRFSGFNLSFKGFYQRLSEKNKVIIKSGAIEIAKTFEVKITTFGLGIDFGTHITEMLNWKILKAAVTFSQADFIESEDRPGVLTEIDDYKSSKANVGYSLSTGFVVYLIGNYISLEGSAGYNLFRFEQLKKADGATLNVNEQSNQPMPVAIDNGGLAGVIQLNFSFPL